MNNEVIKKDSSSFICNVNPSGQIVVDLNMKTSIEGLYAAGDIRINAPKQVISAAGDGSIAALQAISYILEKV